MRRVLLSVIGEAQHKFPFLFGRAFIEAANDPTLETAMGEFPFLFGRAFIEASFVMYEELSLEGISLPFWKGFH